MCHHSTTTLLPKHHHEAPLQTVILATAQRTEPLDGALDLASGRVGEGPEGGKDEGGLRRLGGGGGRGGVAEGDATDGGY